MMKSQRKENVVDHIKSGDRFFDSLRIDYVQLRVLNLEHVSAFYRDVVGLKETERKQHVVRLSASGSEPAQIILVEFPGASPGNATAPGLFHTALLFPSRRELARTVRTIGRKGWRFQGFADHGVSEAVYLADPEGNGLELYHDRPQEEWPRDGSGVAMITEPLDVQNLIEEISDAANSFDEIHAETLIGHVHLQISNLEKAKEFYHGVLGLDITQRDYPGALFLSVNGYHHHVGLNTWNSRGILPASPDSTGLMSVGIRVESPRMAGILERADERSVPLTKADTRTVRLTDPDEIKLDVSLP